MAKALYFLDEDHNKFNRLLGEYGYSSKKWEIKNLIMNM